MTNKKKLGQFFTEPIIADFMVSLGLMPKTQSILDPTAGEGIFIKTINKKNNNYKKTAFEIDPLIANQFNSCISDVNTKLLINDYLTYDLNKKFDLIICNPPYNKFQEINNRKDLINLFYKKYNIKLSGYSNYCIYFLIKSINELKPNGKCIYIIPYEFLNCGYGEIVKDYLLKLKILKTIYKFDNNLKLFSDATTTSCILEIENIEHHSISFININNIEDLQNIDKNNHASISTYDYNILDPKSKWLNYFTNVTDNNEKFKNLIPLKTIGKVSRGIATGSNSYFQLNKEKISKFKLSKEVCLPCITKAPDVKNIIFNEKSFYELYEQNKNVFIFNGEKANSIYDTSYIEFGVRNNIDKLYLTSHRTPWYAIESKEIAPIWISVFSRNKLKIIRNELKIRNLTAFHGLYLNNNLNEEDVNILFCYLLTPISQEILYMNKREYGEGLNKFEPNDLNNAFIIDISKISNTDRLSICNLYNQLINNQEKTIEQLNDIFKKYIY